MIIVLVLLSALLHATWNALLRVEKAREQVLVVAIAVATLFAAIVAAVRWRLGAPPFASWAGVGFTTLAGVFEATYFATLARAMSLGRLGVVYTVSRGGAVLAVWPLSIALFAEVLTLPALGGSVLVLAGLTVSGLGAKGGGREDLPGAVSWSVATAVSIAGYHLCYKAALVEGVNPSACFALSLAVSVAINLSRVVRLERLGAIGRGELRRLVRSRWPALTMMGLVCGGSFLILIEALALGGSGYVLTLRNTSVLFAIAMGWLIGERPTRSDLIGAAAVAAGAALMAW